jgi:hypothetical protein
MALVLLAISYLRKPPYTQVNYVVSHLNDRSKAELPEGAWLFYFAGAANQDLDVVKAFRNQFLVSAYLFSQFDIFLKPLTCHSCSMTRIWNI